MDSAGIPSGAIRDSLHEFLLAARKAEKTASAFDLLERRGRHLLLSKQVAGNALAELDMNVLLGAAADRCGEKAKALYFYRNAVESRAAGEITARRMDGRASAMVTMMRLYMEESAFDSAESTLRDLAREYSDLPGPLHAGSTVPGGWVAGGIDFLGSAMLTARRDAEMIRLLTPLAEDVRHEYVRFTAARYLLRYAGETGNSALVDHCLQIIRADQVLHRDWIDTQAGLNLNTKRHPAGM